MYAASTRLTEGNTHGTIYSCTWHPRNERIEEAEEDKKKITENFLLPFATWREGMASHEFAA